MPLNPALHQIPSYWGRAVLRGLASWWHMLHFGAVMLVLALSPSSYSRSNRATTLHNIYTETWLVLPWFTSLSALLSLVLIRIVVVTALSYGLSQYALEMVVRVLVLELIPLAAALYVALRAGLAFNAGDPRNLRLAPDGSLASLGLVHLQQVLLPKVLASAFAVIALAMVSSVIALVMAYLMVYGLSPWGLPGYTRTVGHVFDLTVTLGFLLKAGFFSLAVALVPMAASLDATQQALRTSTVQPGAVRLFLVLLLIEAAFLAVKYI